MENSNLIENIETNILFTDHIREPIEHTCPDIDKVLLAINEVDIICSKRFDKHIAGTELGDVLDSIYFCIYGLDQILEKLRMSNDELRRWGRDEANAVDNLTKFNR